MRESIGNRGHEIPQRNVSALFRSNCRLYHELLMPVSLMLKRRSEASTRAERKGSCRNAKHRDLCTTGCPQSVKRKHIDCFWVIGNNGSTEWQYRPEELLRGAI